MTLTVRRWSAPIGGATYPIEVALGLPGEELALVVRTRLETAV